MEHARSVRFKPNTAIRQASLSGSSVSCHPPSSGRSREILSVYQQGSIVLGKEASEEESGLVISMSSPRSRDERERKRSPSQIQVCAVRATCVGHKCVALKNFPAPYDRAQSEHLASALVPYVISSCSPHGAVTTDFKGCTLWSCANGPRSRDDLTRWRCAWTMFR